VGAAIDGSISSLSEGLIFAVSSLLWSTCHQKHDSLVQTSLLSTSASAGGSNDSSDEGAVLKPESDGEPAPDYFPLFAVMPPKAFRPALAFFLILFVSYFAWLEILFIALVSTISPCRASRRAIPGILFRNFSHLCATVSYCF
jgi:hypothetical protein